MPPTARATGRNAAVHRGRRGIHEGRYDDKETAHRRPDRVRTMPATCIFAARAVPRAA